MYTYCYINTIYKGEYDVYELIATDKYFRHFSLLRFDIKQLKDFYEKNQNLVFNFKFENSYLKLNINDLNQVELNNVIEESKGKFYTIKRDNTFNFYTFINEAITNNYLFVDNSVIMNDCIKGSGVTAFYNIKFSRSTMTVYFILKINNGLLNRNIVTMEDTILKTHEFYFAVPLETKTEFPNTIEYIKDININNSDYKLYKCNLLLLYTNEVLTFGTIINKADCLSSKYKVLLDTLNDFYKILLKRTLNEQSCELEWVGGNGDHRSQYGIIFKNNCKKYTEFDRSELIKTALIVLTESKNKEELLASLERSSKNKLELTILTLIVQIQSKSSIYESIEYLVHQMNTITQNKTLFDLYLYNIRANTYIRKDYISKILSGSDEPYTTYVSGGFSDEVN